MATVTVIDYRRTDQRTNVLHNPYWITSGAFVGADSEDKYAVLFSFPSVKKYIILEVYVQVVTAFTASTTIDIGYATLATDAVTTGGVGTTVDDDEYVKNTDVTVGTPGYYAPTTSNTSDWLTAKIAGSYAAPYVLTGAATTVPAVVAVLANTGTIAAGVGRVHMLITEVP